MAWNRGSKIERMKLMLRYIFIWVEPRCHFCKELLNWETFYPSLAKKQIDEITFHHLDHNHENDTKDNLAPCHRSCHRRYHRNYDLKQKQLNDVSIKGEQTDGKIL